MEAPDSVVGEAVIEDLLTCAAGTPLGAFVEVGVYKGGTAHRLHQLALSQGRQLYLYDTFTGLPFQDECDSMRVGDFADTDLAQVQEACPRAVITQGIFPGTALAEMGLIAFVHLDVDQYRSYQGALAYLIPRLQSGAVIWLDDYGYLLGATIACDEAVKKFGLDLSSAACNKKFIRIDKCL